MIHCVVIARLPCGANGLRHFAGYVGVDARLNCLHEPISLVQLAGFASLVVTLLWHILQSG